MLQNGQTALAIAQKLNYINVVDVLKDVTSVEQTLPVSEDKYKVVSPETMQETLISDSEDEGGKLVNLDLKVNNQFLMLDIHIYLF